MTRQIDRSYYRPWVRWLCERRMAWVVRLVLVFAFPIIWGAYLTDAVDDFKRAWRDIK
jgi:hypothetical protein